MRIVSGLYGGRRLNTPDDNAIRPTSDKVRGAVFNALLSRADLDGARVADLYCGTGALGLEALSRGAEHCRFLDKSRKSLNLAKSNAADLNVPDSHALFQHGDAAALPLLADDQQLDLVFLDPPYDRGLLKPSLESLHAQSWLKTESFIVAETESDYNAEAELDYLRPHFCIEDCRTYGAAQIIYISYRGDL